MYVRQAFQYVSREGYELKEPEEYLNLRVYSGVKRDGYGKNTDAPVVRIEMYNGGIHELLHPTIRFDADGMTARGLVTNMWLDRRPPEEARGPLIHVMEEWRFIVNMTKEDEASIDKRIQKMVADYRKLVGV